MIKQIKSVMLCVSILIPLSGFISNVAASNNYYSSLGGQHLVALKKSSKVYQDANFKKSLGTKKRGTILTVTKVKYSSHKTPRLVLNDGTFITANKSYVVKVTKKLANYIYTNSTYNVQAKKSVIKYKDVSFKAKISKYKSGSVVKVKGVSWSDGGTPRLLVSGGYITANKGTITKNIKKTSSKGQKVIAYAKKYLNVPYVYGGATPNGFDCSGLVQYVYKKAVGIKLTRTTGQQATHNVKKVSLNKLKAGDLLFWGKGKNAYHVAIYIGSGKYIHAPKPGDHVKITKIANWKPTTAARVNNM